MSDKTAKDANTATQSIVATLEFGRSPSFNLLDTPMAPHVLTILH